MNTPINVIHYKHHAKSDAAGSLDHAASKTALVSLVANSGFEISDKVLLDFRGVDCEMSTTDVFAVATTIFLSSAALQITQRIALLVAEHRVGHLPFNNAQFLELCADSLGPNVRAFADGPTAEAWLEQLHAHDPHYVTTMPGTMKPFAGGQPENVSS